MSVAVRSHLFNHYLDVLIRKNCKIDQISACLFVCLFFFYHFCNFIFVCSVCLLCVQIDMKASRALFSFLVMV